MITRPTVDLARIGHRQTTIHYGLEYDWIQSLPDCPGWSAEGQQIHQERPTHRVSHWQPRHEMALCIRQTLVFGRRDRQTQTADADVRIADSDFEISKVLKSF